LQKIPVRKQTALKDAAKTLQAIKALLAAFAFARPNVRLSLKVLKSKTDKGNFTYAPSPRDRLKDIAAKLAGKDVAAECEDYHVSSADEAHLQEQESDGWELDALLLRPDAGR
jgi:DNA mismatch repair ATPase MutL